MSGVAANSTDLLPNNVTTQRDSTNLIFPSLPQGPRFVDFPNQDTLNGVATAFVDALRLALEAWAAVSANNFDEDQSYKRYFQLDQQCNIQNTLRWLLNDGAGPATMPDLLEIRFEFSSNDDNAEVTCEKDPQLSSYIVHRNKHDGRFHAEMIICPFAFEGSKKLDTVSCNSLFDRSTKVMDVPGANVLHEVSSYESRTGATGTLQIDGKLVTFSSF